MHELALDRPAAVSLDEPLEREFQERLAASATLAFRVAYAVLRHREDAEDVAQEAMAQAYRNFARLHDRGRFQPWLVRIAWRLAVNRRRGDGRRAGRERAVETGQEAADAEALVLSREFEEHLWRAVDALPEPLRAVLLLCAAQGYEVREVAEALAVPEGTVKSRLHRARRVLAEKLEWLTRGVGRS
jgi:RNA polymerase sigma-70 factor (ECF subfamily)